jgi:hypothetical protein
MNDHEIDELLRRGNVLLEDLDARERARVRLRALIAHEEAAPARRRRRLLGLVAAAAAVVVGLLVLQILLPPGAGGPRLSAAEELRRLGRLSTALKSVGVGPNDYVYSHTLEHAKQTPTDEGDYNLAVTMEVETWLATDGSGARETTPRQVVLASSVDHQKWLDAGSPPLPEVGKTTPERFSANGLPYYAVETLPTDPTALRNALDSGDVIETGEGDANLLVAIGILLSQDTLSSELREALFEVAASIPSVSVEYGVKDNSGRPAVSVMASDGSVDTKLFFDESDARLLGTSVALPPAEGRPAITGWTVYLVSGIV